MERKQILPQTIFEFRCTPELLKDTQSRVADLGWEFNMNNYRSNDIYLNKNHLFNDLHEWFHECLVMVKRSVEYMAEDIKVTQSWANKAEQGQWHHPHKHPNSIFSGIFYLTESNSGTRFILPSIWEMYSMEGPNVQPFQHFLPDFVSTVQHIEKEEPGKLLIFPSVLEHGVEPNQSPDPRYTISFNSFLCGDIGHFGMLSGLTIDVK